MLLMFLRGHSFAGLAFIHYNYDSDYGKDKEHYNLIINGGKTGFD